MNCTCGEARYNLKVDVWSFGIVLIKLVGKYDFRPIESELKEIH